MLERIIIFAFYVRSFNDLIPSSSDHCIYAFLDRGIKTFQIAAAMVS